MQTHCKLEAILCRLVALTLSRNRSKSEDLICSIFSARSLFGVCLFAWLLCREICGANTLTYVRKPKFMYLINGKRFIENYHFIWMDGAKSKELQNEFSSNDAAKRLIAMYSVSIVIITLLQSLAAAFPDYLSITLSLVAFLYYFIRNYNFFKKHGIVHVQPTPLFGNMGSFARR
ncbi:hypothetical protein E2986_13935 [Frieseomelitta varia]|uniref:Uncharacterized protein n=1 Tax=Frieseomelitta varia TaxID=561572 RepID=A0A833SDJ0_9HYME|nr:hypothetical protein E2986_13935 [Frieseomelitta varia]